MKLILLATITILASAAAEHPRGQMIQLCGAQLARALKQVCEDGDLDFSNLQQVQKQHHEHNHYHEQEARQWEGHSTKRDASYSLADECCAKPCHFKDFATYCP